jgi:hypothetical protein
MLFLALLAVTLLLIGAVLPLVLPRHCPVTRAAFERIEKGKTQEEVYAILGGPPGDYRTRPRRKELVVQGPEPDRWFGDQGDVMIWFDEGIVGHTMFGESKAKPVGPFEVLLWRLDRLLP